MATTYPHILADVLEMMTKLAGDWEYTDSITAETNLFGDLGFESLDLVVLGTALQERYGRLPFTEFLAEIGQRPTQDISVGELVAFVGKNLGTTPTGEAR